MAPGVGVLRGAGVGGFKVYKRLIIKLFENIHPPTPSKIWGSADGYIATC